MPVTASDLLNQISIGINLLKIDPYPVVLFVVFVASFAIAYLISKINFILALLMTALVTIGVGTIIVLYEFSKLGY